MIKVSKKLKKTYSLEQQLKRFGYCFVAAFLLLILFLMHLLSLSALVQITILTAVFIPTILYLSSFYQKIIAPFYRLTNLVEAIRLEDYSLRLNPLANKGILGTLSQEISDLSDDLQQRKQQYDQHTLLIFHLIEQLDAPIAIFNEKLKLSHANAAFSNYISQPWQNKRLASSKQLGLELKNQWEFTDEIKSNQWQIKESQFIQNEQTFHLVVLTNVEKILRTNQQKSWQQIIRVLGHEIRNSLTPIKSLAQTLSSMPDQSQQASTALKVIIDRSVSLQEFVNRYSDVSKHLKVNKTHIKCDAYLNEIKALFPHENIGLTIKAPHIYADPVLLKQVLINLVKNALEASIDAPDNSIHITVKENNSSAKVNAIIEITDNGTGIANTDNLFVPFYTTKNNGQGIGLGLCRNIIEQHGGRLSLTNNNDRSGATAQIKLPSTMNG